jgi:YidC/Oxa1 family membrane protein insertase
VSHLHNPNLPIPNSGNSRVRITATRLVLLFTAMAILAILVFNPASQIIGQSIQPPVPSATQTNFGWLTFIAMPLYGALRFLHQHGISNWGWAIILSTAVFNLLTFWPRIMSLQSSLKMMRVQPKVDELKRRYAHLKIDDPRRASMNTELMAIYKQEGISMFGGCLPMLVQMPLLFAYFRVLQNAAELHQAHWYWLTDLSLPDPLHLLPLLIVATMFLTQLITPAPGMDRAQRRIFLYIVPVVMGFTLWRYASGLALYWATGNILSLAIQCVINRTSLGREMHQIAARRLIAREQH